MTTPFRFQAFPAPLRSGSSAGYVWILGGAIVGLAGARSAWRSDTTPVLFWCWAVGGSLIAVAALWSAGIALRRGSRLPALGLLLFLAGFLTLFFGIGVILAVIGFLLYVAGLDRARVVGRHSLLTALTMVVLAVATIALPWNEVVGIEIAAAAAVATGIGAFNGRGKRGSSDQEAHLADRIRA